MLYSNAGRWTIVLVALFILVSLRVRVRARLDLLAIERRLNPAEIPKVIEIDEALLAFVRRHEVNLDWLFRGDIRGLLAMAECARWPGSYAVGRDLY